jgi:hypothetical protein
VDKIRRLAPTAQGGGQSVAHAIAAVGNALMDAIQSQLVVSRKPTFHR